MKSLADIKRRLASVKQTRQITGAMETISVSKMRKALERFEMNSVYFDILYGVMRDIAASPDMEVKEFLNAPKIEKKLVIVVASDKGLCGSFNHDVFKLADTVIDENTIVIPIGQFVLDHFKHGEVEIDDRFVSGVTPDYRVAEAISDAVFDMYGKSVGKVTIIYTRMLSRSTWQAQAVDLLPLDGNNVGDERVQGTDLCGVEFEPSRIDVLKMALPLYIGGMIYGAFVHSAAAEHGARHAAMSASSKNADDMIDALSIEYNSARQSSVTGQIIDIVGSAQAIGEV